MLYKIAHDKDCFELNPELHSIPEFAKLTDKQFRFTALVADKKSPIRTLPDKERREKATIICGYPMEGNRPAKNARVMIAGQVPSVEAAILKYKEYQFDENQDSLNATNNLIRTNRDFINNVNNRKDEEKKDKQYGKDLELANKFAKQLPELEEARLKLEQILQITVENKPEITTYSSLDVPEEVIEGEESMSTIDLFWANQPNKE
jgi:hypothetical protein